MLINCYCPSKDKTFSLDVLPELTLEVFKKLCEEELGASSRHIQVMRDGTRLTDDNKQLRQLNIADADFLILEVTAAPPQQRAAPTNQQRPNLPLIDFSSVQVPTREQRSTTQPRRQQPAMRAAAPSSGNALEDLTDANAVAEQLRADPNTLALLRERNPALAEALDSNDTSRFAAELEKIRQARANAEMERIRMLNADPMDPEVQRRIAEEIERKNIEENMNLAIENAPESFGQVCMLWINLRVNGHHVKAFVDSGAQMTIMSAECAERCNIMRLVDKRWAGIAKGVGTQKIIGRIHLAQIQIENIFLPCSFSVLEDQPMNVLLGLDMLRRHQCVLNLRENHLSICTPSANIKTYFLPEAEIPTHGKLTGNDEVAKSSTTSTTATPQVSAGASSSTTDDQKIDEDQKCKDEKMDTVEASSSSKGSGPTPSAGGGQKPQDDSKLSQLLDMGFSQADAEIELKECGGDLQNAIASLLRKKMM